VFDNPLDYGFWSAEEAKMWNAVAPTSLDIFFAGGVGGSDLLPPDLQILIDWGAFNDAGINWLNNWRFNGYLGKVHLATKDKAIKYINEWAQSGEALPVLEAKLNTLFDPLRARRIAHTEVTRIYSEGNQAAWRASGMVSGKRWHTVEADNVCVICRGLNGTVADINGMFEGDIAGPPAHVSCRCFPTPVTSDKMLRDARRRDLGLP